jgi:hypothetical protein
MYLLLLVSLMFIFFCFVSLSLLIVNCLKKINVYIQILSFMLHILSIQVCNHSASVTDSNKFRCSIRNLFSPFSLSTVKTGMSKLNQYLFVFGVLIIIVF